MRITLGQARQELSYLPGINLTADDPRMVPLVNRCIERMIEEGRGDLLHRKIRLCIYDRCVTTPASVAALTEASVGMDRVDIVNQWYEFLPGRDTFVGQNEAGCSLTIHDRGEVCAFSDIVGTNKTLRVYTDQVEDLDTFITFYGTDPSRRWIRTEHTPGNLKDGFRLHIGGVGPFDSPQAIGPGGLDHVQKDKTKGAVRVYELDPAGNQRLIAVYEHSERWPSYRRYLVRGGWSAGTTPQTVTAMAKLEYHPAENDDDLLLIPSMEAIRIMAEAVMKLNNNDAQGGMAMSAAAMNRLGMHREHKVPKEQMAVSIRAQGTADQNRLRIGRLR